MYLFKISLLLYCIQISTGEKESTRDIRNSYNHHHISTRRYNRDDKNCVCFPGGQSLIPELLNPQEYGLERLVVYIYKDSNSQQIKLFTPSPEKQALIPNVPFSTGDSLKPVTTQTIASLINPDSSNPIFGLKEDLTHGPIGFNWGTVQPVSPKISFYDVLHGLPAQPGYASQIFHGQLYQGLPHQDEIGGRRHTIYSNPGYNYQLYPQHNPYKHRPTILHTKQEPNINVANDQIQAIPGNSIQNVFGWDQNGKKYNFPLNPYQNSHGSQYVPISPHQQPRFPAVLPKHDIYAPGVEISNSYLTFDQWFQHQMEIFQDAEASYNHEPVNTDVLRSLVQKTLLENQMLVGTSGQITDEHGALINLGNLALRPVLIGNSIRYHQVLKGSEQLDSSKHLPYLEAILVTLIYPPRVLGVVPLGKTYVSKGTSQDSLISSVAHKYPQFPVSPADINPLSNLLNTNLNVPNIQYQNGQWNYPGTQTPSFGFVAQHPSISPLFSNVGLSDSNISHANSPWKSEFGNYWGRRNALSKKIKTKKTKAATKSKVKTHKALKEARGSYSTELPEIMVSESTPHWSVSVPEDLTYISGLEQASLISPTKLISPSNSWQSQTHVGVAPYQDSYPNSQPNGVSLLPPWQKNSQINPSWDSATVAYPHSNSNWNPDIIAGLHVKNTKIPIVEPWNGQSWKPSSKLVSNVSPSWTPEIIADLDEKSTEIPIAETWKLSNKPIPRARPDWTPKVIADLHVKNTGIPVTEPWKPQSWNPTSNHANSQWTESMSGHGVKTTETVTVQPWKPGTPEGISYQDTYSQIYGTSQPNVVSVLSPKPNWNSLSNPSWKRTVEAFPHASSQFIFENNPRRHVNVLESTPLVLEKNNLVKDSEDLKVIMEGGNIENPPQLLGQSRRFPGSSIQGVIKSIIGMFLQNLSQGKGFRRSGQGAETNMSGSDPIESKFGDEDRPDFRIIGGSAATGSGVPISNRGRSGKIK